MGKIYLIDTNIVVRYISGELSKTGLNLIDILVGDFKGNISFVNRIELHSWKLDKKTGKLVNDFLKAVHEISLSEKIIQKTIEIRRSNKIKLPDAMMAASGLVHNFTLLTENEIDFKVIPKLQILNPTKEITN